MEMILIFYQKLPHNLTKLHILKRIRVIIPVLWVGLIPIIFGCGESTKKSSSSSYSSDIEEYKDGTYCAEIDYYYSETGTSSTYTLEVEIENNELTMIHWPNGGWLDESHFSPPDISEGEATFTSDRGIDYTVKITGKEGDCTLDSYVTDEDELIWQNEEEEQERISQEEEDENTRIQEEDDYE